jgi:hypothetical protein
LEFGSPGKFFDPKDSLTQVGPFGLSYGDAHLKEVRIAIVGTEGMINKSLMVEYKAIKSKFDMAYTTLLRERASLETDKLD